MARLPVSAPLAPSLAAASPAAATSAPDAGPALRLVSQFVRDSVYKAMTAADGTEGAQAQQPGGWPDWPTVPSDGGPEWEPSLPTPHPGAGDGRSHADHTLAILIPLIVVLSTLLVLIFLLTVLLLRRRRGIELTDEGGPTNLEREDEVEGEGGLDGVEARWLQTVDEPTKMGYVRAKIWQTQYPPNSQPTEITLSQFLSIQEKGVSAWSFEPDYESNPAIIVESRTEVTFLADGYGMAPEEGGGCCVQSNLPIPKLNDVYYFESKMYEKPEGTNVSIGLATKPYPSFRLPGVSRYSVGYQSSDGFKSHSFPFTATSYGPPLLEGDTLGVGYRPRTGTVFFTRNGKKLDEAFVGFNKHNVFPTIGANGPCSVHVNLGQAGFVFIEANVKKWGLAPMMGTLAPPPAYGSERGSILLESAANPAAASSSSSSAAAARRNPAEPGHRRTSSLPASASSAAAVLGSTPTQPIRPSPLRHAHSRHASASSSSATGGGRGSPAHEGDDAAAGDGEPHNPPTPGLLDISLHSMHRFPDPLVESDEEDGAGVEDGASEGSDAEGDEEGEETRLVQPVRGEEARARGGDGASARSVSPPAYNPVDPYMYAPGVAETMLEDAFAAVSAAAPPQSGGANPGTRGPATQLVLSPHQAALVAQFARTRRAAGSGNSSPGPYEARTEGFGGRGGVGNYSGVGAGGLWGWLTGRSGGGDDARAEEGLAGAHPPPPAAAP
ncbi:Protein ssh4 [Rhodotorula kratochvilovae]